MNYPPFIGEWGIKVYGSMAEDPKNKLVRGEELSPLPSTANVMRAVKKSSNDTADEPFRLNMEPLRQSFRLNSEDEKSNPPALSVYAETMTTPRQCIELLSSPENYSHVARLNVSEIRRIEIHDINYITHPDFVAPDVLWIAADDPSPPGADGHCGVVGLKEVKGFRAICKSIRRQLAEIASKDYRALPDWEPVNNDSNSTDHTDSGKQQ